MPLDSRLDLALAAVSEPAAGQLLAATQTTAAGLTLAALFGLAFAITVFFARRAAADGWMWAIYPYGLLAPVFLAVAVGLAFGRHEKAFRDKRLFLAASLGPWSKKSQVPLPEKGVVRVTFRREQNSSTGGAIARSTRWYDVDVDGVPAAGFTVAGDRDAARAFAARLAKTLGYKVVDEAEDDGVERLKPGDPRY